MPNGQQSQPQKFADARIGKFLPANSTDIAASDPVMLNTDDRIVPLTATAIGATRFVGFCESKWNAQVAADKWGNVTSTGPYATPASWPVDLVVLGPETVVEVAIANTSGKAGQVVYLGTASTGAYVFTLTQPATSGTVVTVGTLERSFTGATANDCQRVVVQPTMRSTYESAMEYWMANHVIDGLGVAFKATSAISFKIGKAFVGGKMFSLAAQGNTLAAAVTQHATKAQIVLYYMGTGGTALVKKGSVRFTRTSAGATTAAIIKNSWFWPTFSFTAGVIFGAALYASNSTIATAPRVWTVRRSITDVKFRKSIKGNPYTSGQPTL